MPKPLNIDWEHAKTLYMKGMSLPDIAAQTGTSYTALRAHALRHQWKADATKAAAVVQHAVAATLEERGRAWGGRIANVVEKHLTYIEQLEPGRMQLRDFEILARLTSTTDQTARRNFGLDGQGQAGTVVGLKVNLRIDQASQNATEVIDVPSSADDVRGEQG